jgi:Spy/CpxP family protein refolding chaperone
MNAIKNYLHQFVFLGVLTLSGFGSVYASLPDPQDPQVVANMTFEQRLQMSKDLREQFKQATPEERRQYRQKLHAKLMALTPGERKQLREKIHAQWKSLTPEQRKQLRDNRKAMIGDLTPEEREEMKKNREQWKRNHPDAKGNWNTPMTN